jgi:hypothetical protein
MAVLHPDFIELLTTIGLAHSEVNFSFIAAKPDLYDL